MIGGLSDRRSVPRLAALVALLVFAWIALWGELSIANLVSGLVVAVAAVVAGFLGRSGSPRVPIGLRLVALIRLLALIAADLLLSTLNVAWEVVTPTDYTDEAITAIRLPDAARHHLLLLVVGVTVTPGTAVVDVDRDGPTLYLHLLHHDRRDDVEERVHRLAELACAAFPVPASSPAGERPS